LIVPWLIFPLFEADDDTLPGRLLGDFVEQKFVGRDGRGDAGGDSDGAAEQGADDDQNCGEVSP